MRKQKNRKRCKRVNALVYTTTYTYCIFNTLPVQFIPIRMQFSLISQMALWALFLDLIMWCLVGDGLFKKLSILLYTDRTDNCGCIIKTPLIHLLSTIINQENRVLRLRATGETRGPSDVNNVLNHPYILFVVMTKPGGGDNLPLNDFLVTIS